MTAFSTSATRALALGRIAIGTAVGIRPALVARSATTEADADQAKLLARMFAIRELATGVLTLVPRYRDGALAAGLLADVVDGVLAARSPSSPKGDVALAATFAAIGTGLLAETGRAR